MADLAALTAAAEGADGMFGIIPVLPRTRPNRAAGAGVEKVVFSSIYHPTLALANRTNTQPAERALYESNLDFTILRPAIFMAQLYGLWQTPRTRAGSLNRI